MRSPEPKSLWWHNQTYTSQSSPHALHLRRRRPTPAHGAGHAPAGAGHRHRAWWGTCARCIRKSAVPCLNRALHPFFAWPRRLSHYGRNRCRRKHPPRDGSFPDTARLRSPARVQCVGDFIGARIEFVIVHALIDAHTPQNNAGVIAVLQQHLPQHGTGAVLPCPITDVLPTRAVR